MEPYLGRTGRYWELDFIRGLAVIAMALFHLLFDLNYFAGQSFSLDSGIWFFVGRFSGTAFIFLAGVSLTLSYSRVSGLSQKQINSGFLRRGLKIFLYGMAITVFTLLAFPQETILFGVLHLIGLSIILSAPFLKLRGKENLFLGTVIIVLGLIVSTMRFGFPWLLWLGLTPLNFITFDYFPLLPWFGLVLLGIFFGKLLYPRGKRKIEIVDFSKSILVRAVCFIGRNSLPIYFLHQPIIVAIILLI